MRAGAIVVPLNTTIADDSMAAMLSDAGASMLFASADHAHRLNNLPLPDSVKRIAHAGPQEAPPPAGWTDYAAWRAAQTEAVPDIALAPDDACNIIYSSGTTGLPKGITHSHGARLAWTHDLAHVLRYGESTRLLIATGLYSNITWAGMLPALLLGARMTILHGFDSGQVLAAIARDRITNVSLVPVQFQRMLEHPDFERTDLSSMRAMMCCGSALPARTKEALFQHFACGVIELYGTTEGLITTLAPEEAMARMASVGKPAPGADLMVLDNDDNPVAPGESGEIVMRTRYAMSGYWNRPDATEEAFFTDPQGRRWRSRCA
jgi:acyl-coenzyme A synthetase/AMP-(fatty) acid ligase